MFKPIKKKWLNALKSGEYDWYPSKLCFEYPNGDCEFSALGVLCDLYAQHTKGKAGYNEKVGNYLIFEGLKKDFSCGYLIKEVLKWSGLTAKKAEAVSAENYWGGFPIEFIQAKL